MTLSRVKPKAFFFQEAFPDSPARQSHLVPWTQTALTVSSFRACMKVHPHRPLLLTLFQQLFRALRIKAELLTPSLPDLARQPLGHCLPPLSHALPSATVTSLLLLTYLLQAHSTLSFCTCRSLPNIFTAGARLLIQTWLKGHLP